VIREEMNPYHEPEEEDGFSINHEIQKYFRQIVFNFGLSF